MQLTIQDMTTVAAIVAENPFSRCRQISFAGNDRKMPRDGKEIKDPLAASSEGDGKDEDIKTVNDAKAKKAKAKMLKKATGGRAVAFTSEKGNGEDDDDDDEESDGDFAPGTTDANHTCIFMHVSCLTCNFQDGAQRQKEALGSLCFVAKVKTGRRKACPRFFGRLVE